MRTRENTRFIFGVAGLSALLILILCFGADVTLAQDLPVTAQVEIARSAAAKSTDQARNGDDQSNVVIWLTPLDRSASVPTGNGDSKSSTKNDSAQQNVRASSVW